MLLSTAESAVPLVKAITERQDKIVEINNAIANNWQIAEMRCDGPQNAEINLVLETLDVAISQQALQFVLQIYTTQLDALNTQLAAL